METAVVVDIPEIAAEFPPWIIAPPGPRVVHGSWSGGMSPMMASRHWHA